jgi:hypothetical protein
LAGKIIASILSVYQGLKVGFNVDPVKRVVSVDHQHNEYAVTTVEGNPVSKSFAGIKVISVFARTKARRDRSTPGDNCPMLYALKGQKDLKTGYRSIVVLYQNYIRILSNIVEEWRPHGTWDCIIPIPSSSNLPSLMAKSVFSHSGGDVVQTKLLSKISAKQVLDSIDELAISAKDRATLRARVKNFIREHGGDSAFQIKCVDTKLRKHLNPFVLMPEPTEAPPQRVLLVDDMITSGTSIISAANLLRERYAGVHIEAITLFGSSR